MFKCKIKYKNYCLLCANKQYELVYYKGVLYVYENKKIKCCHRINNFFCFSIVSRLLRKNPRAAVALNNNTFLVSCHGVIYRLSVNENSLIVEHKFSKGMNNPLTFCTRRDNDGNIIDVLYGEYIDNLEKGPVSIYRRFLDGWKVVYEFPAHTIKHIHNIVYDKYRNRYLILTGDSDSESGIWESDVNFSNVRPIFQGSQKYRACILMPTKNGLYYVTDTPLEQNYVYYLDNTGYLNIISKIKGPCIFGVEKNDCLYFATSVEGDSSVLLHTLGKWIYMLSYKLGKGVEDRYSHLYRLSKYGTLEELEKMKKDWLPMLLFEFGNMKFPPCDDEEVYICPQSLKGKSGTYVLKNE